MRRGRRFVAIWEPPSLRGALSQFVNAIMYDLTRTAVLCSYSFSFFSPYCLFVYSRIGALKLYVVCTHRKIHFRMHAAR